MNIEIIFNWVFYITIGILAALVLVGFPLALLSDKKDHKHSEVRRFERDNVGYREEPIE